MNSELRYYISLVMKRLPLVALVSTVLSTAAVVFAILQPSKYESEALLLVESPQIPDNLASSTVANNAPEQLEIIEQRLLTRANLIDIANDLNVFPNRTDLVPDDIVDLMRERTSFSRSFGRDRATLLTISFEAEQPAVTAAVVNEYVTRVLEENVELRTTIAEQTLDFFEQETERLSQDLDRQSARILEFKNNNLDALPESMDYRLGRQSLLLERRAQLERDKSALAEQRERLVQVFNATGQAGLTNTRAATPEQAQLARLRDELSGALAIYSDQNPRVKVLKSRIEQLEKLIAESAGADVEGEVGNANPNEALLNLQLSEIDSRLSFIDEQLQLITLELADLEDSISRTPANAITLEALERDYENIRARFDSASARLAAAATGERIELTSKGQRITVLRQAVVPREPSSPNRPLIIATGIAAALGIAGALVVLLELMNRTIKRPADLTRALGITPIATVPYIATGGELARRRGAVGLLVVLIAVGLPAALYYVHVEYLPLDLLADRALARIGL